MGKIFMIIGKSFSGKDTLLNNILLDEEFCKENNLHQLVRCTTRKPRPNEVDGKDYYFISNEEFLNEYMSREDVISASYKSEFGVLHYITDFSKLEPDKNYIVVSDPESIEKYKKVLGQNLCIIYLIPPNWEIFRRFSGRDDNSEYSDLKYKEIYRRFIDDTVKFGKHSNTYLANCNAITVLGKDYSLNELKDNISQCLKYQWDNVGILMTSGGSTLLYNNKYDPSKRNPKYFEIIEYNEIIISNGIVINTENESYETVDHFEAAIRFNHNLNIN